MTASHDIRPITAAETRPLRHAILRPDQAIEECVYPTDDAPDTLHAGAFLDSKFVGIASVAREQFPDEPHLNAWRLRGMATVAEVRRMGYGAALVRACIAHVAAQSGNLLWCNGRTSAREFYETLGFRTHGDEYESPAGTGPHHIFRREVSPEEK
ncbi:MAG: GNAT family N-acetyltransferase [Chloroflexi bacterium]|nr:GNAT family N-acetyltransferase [Chloroflexota bacterium]